MDSQEVMGPDDQEGANTQLDCCASSQMESSKVVDDNNGNTNSTMVGVDSDQLDLGGNGPPMGLVGNNVSSMIDYSTMEHRNINNMGANDKAQKGNGATNVGSSNIKEDKGVPDIKEYQWLKSFSKWIVHQYQNRGLSLREFSNRFRVKFFTLRKWVRTWCPNGQRLKGTPRSRSHLGYSKKLEMDGQTIGVLNRMILIKLKIVRVLNYGYKLTEEKWLDLRRCKQQVKKMDMASIKQVLNELMKCKIAIAKDDMKHGYGSLFPYVKINNSWYLSKVYQENSLVKMDVLNQIDVGFIIRTGFIPPLRAGFNPSSWTYVNESFAGLVASPVDPWLNSCYNFEITEANMNDELLFDVAMKSTDSDKLTGFRKCTFTTKDDYSGITCVAGSIEPPATDPGGTVTLTKEQFDAMVASVNSNTSDYKLEFSFRKFSGKEKDWVKFKKQLISYLNLKGTSSKDLETYVDAYRLEETSPADTNLSTLLKTVFSTTLLAEAQDMTNEYSDGFLAYIALLERYEPKRLSRFFDLVHKMFTGLKFKPQIDEHVRQYVELNDQLKQFETKLPDKYLIVCIVSSLPMDFIQAKTMIGLKEDITLKEAKSIIESVNDSIQRNRTESTGLALSLTKPTYSTHSTHSDKRRSSNNTNNRKTGFHCYRCGIEGHYAIRCRKVSKDYKCKNCGKNHLESICKNKPGNKVMAVSRPDNWADDLEDDQFSGNIMMVTQYDSEDDDLEDDVRTVEQVVSVRNTVELSVFRPVHFLKLQKLLHETFKWKKHYINERLVDYVPAVCWIKVEGLIGDVWTEDKDNTVLILPPARVIPRNNYIRAFSHKDIVRGGGRDTYLSCLDNRSTKMSTSYKTGIARDRLTLLEDKFQALNLKIDQSHITKHNNCINNNTKKRNRDDVNEKRLQLLEEKYDILKRMIYKTHKLNKKNYHKKSRKYSGKVNMIKYKEKKLSTVGIYVDSGASRHITGNKDLLSDLMLRVMKPMKCANGAELEVLGVGSIVIDDIIIEDVLYCPKAAYNLLSVSELKKKQWEVHFTNNHGDYICNDTYTLQMEMLGGMYRLDRSNYHSAAVVTSIHHRRFGHLNAQAEARLGDATIGSDVKEAQLCVDCIVGKGTRLGAKKHYSGPKRESNNVVYMDFAGPYSNGFNNLKYYLVCVYGDISYITVFPMKKKTSALTAIRKYKLRNPSIQTVQCDRDGVFISNEFTEVLCSLGLLIRYATPYRHEFNGRVERAIRTLMDKARSMLSHASLCFEKYLPFAILTAAVVHNRTPSNKDGKTPYERRYFKQPDVSFIRVFGCKVLIIRPSKYPKNSARAVEGILLGYPVYTMSFGSYNILNLETKQLVHSRDVKFFENKFIHDKLDVNTDYETNNENTDNTDTVMRHNDEMKVNGNSETDIVVENDSSDVDDEVTNESSTIRRSARVRSDKYNHDYAEQRFNEDNTIDGISNVPTPLSVLVVGPPVSIKEPKNVNEAMLSEVWTDAMELEYQTLQGKGTFVKRKREPWMKVIPTKWVYKWKAHELRAKARLVILGFLQNTEEEETFAPTASYQAMRMIIILSALKGLILETMDVDCAFLNADAPEDVFVTIPKGLQISDSDTGVLEVKKSLYGMATSPRAWYQHFTENLKKFGLEPTRIEPCLFVNVKLNLYAVIYVDDILLCGTRVNIDAFKEYISKVYSIKMPGLANRFCGINITKEEGETCVSQMDYIDSVLKRFGLEDCNCAPTPMVVIPEPSTSVTQDPVQANKFPYRELVGSLMFLSTQTRPDITFALGILSRYNHNYNEAHWKAAKRVLRYLKGTREGKLSCGRLQDGEVIKVSAYSDSDWASGKDRKSVSGSVILVNDIPVAWYSKKQSIIALSSTEAELIALVETVKHVKFIRSLLEAFGLSLEKSSVVLGDNNASLLIAAQGVTARSKHIDIRRCYIKDSIDNGSIILRRVDTKENLADLLTKTLAKPTLDYLKTLLFSQNKQAVVNSVSTVEGVVYSGSVCMLGLMEDPGPLDNEVVKEGDLVHVCVCGMKRRTLSGCDCSRVKNLTGSDNVWVVYWEVLYKLFIVLIVLVIDYYVG